MENPAIHALRGGLKWLNLTDRAMVELEPEPMKKLVARQKQGVDEFTGPPNPNLEGAAVVIQEGWMQCPSCSDAWRSESAVGNLRCSTCGKWLRNPCYPK